VSSSSAFDSGELLILARVAVALLLAWPGQAAAAALDALVKAAIARAPEVKAAEARLQAAEARLQAAERSLQPSWQASVRLSEDRAPTISSFQSVRTRRFTTEGGITKPLASGDLLSLSASLSGIDQRFDSPFAQQLATLNPAWRGALDFSWRHPLGQGKNAPDWRAAVVRARADWIAARAELAVAKRRVALDVLQKAIAFLRARARLRLAKENLARARRLQANERMRARLGLVERADQRATDALASTRELDLARAKAALRLARVQFARALHLSAQRKLPAFDAVLEDVSLPQTEKEAFELAWRHRPEVKMLQARLEAATKLVAIAREKAKPKADLVLQLGMRSLDGSPAPALGKTVSTQHPFVALGLELSDALGTADEARIRAAEADRIAAEAELRRFSDALATELAEALARLRNAEEELAAAKARVLRERRAYAAELRRHREGRGSFSRLLQAEGSLAAAEYEAIDAELRLQQAKALLAWSLALRPFDADKPLQEQP